MRYRDPRGGAGFAPWLDGLKGRSGVYVFRSGGAVEYVGESHSGNLYRTIVRHFWRWRDSTGRRHYTVGLFPVQLAVKLTSPSEAVEEQNRLIVRLRPRHNRHVSSDEVPF